MYEVVCGNIGTVYRGGDQDQALANYYRYVKDSKEGYGRAAWEDVVIFRPDGSILFEHTHRQQEVKA